MLLEHQSKGSCLNPTLLVVEWRLPVTPTTQVETVVVHSSIVGLETVVLLEEDEPHGDHSTRRYNQYLYSFLEQICSSFKWIVGRRV